MPIKSILPASLLALTVFLPFSAVAHAASTNMANPQNGHMNHRPDNEHHNSNPGHGGKKSNLKSIPTMPGQDAFGTIQEILALLEADPSTDWSRVDINGLREHLVDMDLLITGTNATEKSVDGGLEISVAATGRALQAVQRMLPAHARTIDGVNGWVVSAQLTASGGKLTIKASDTKEINHIRGLGFYGIMATGNHHQSHHYSIALGQNAGSH